MMLCCSSQVQADQSGDYTYSITDGKARITKYTGAGGVDTVPSTLSGSFLTSVGTQIGTTTDVKVTGVKLNKKTTTINIEASETLSAIITPTNATNKTVTWKSSKPSVATVDSNGKVVGVKAGTTTITVTTMDGKKTAACKVTVKSPPTVKVTKVSLNKKTTSITLGAYEILTATIDPTGATNQNVTWKSSKTSVATVDSTGKVLGVKAGTATITVTTVDGKKTANCTVTVTNIADIVATTSELYEGEDDPVLGFAVDGVDKTVTELTSAGYTVEFQATWPIFYGDSYKSSDGIVNMNSISRLGEFATFEYKVVISKGSTVVTSNSTKVTVKSAQMGTHAIASAKIFLANDGEIDGNNVEIKSGTLTVHDEAYLRVRGTNADDDYGSITTTVKYSSSDPAIAYVDKANIQSYFDDDYAKIVMVGQTGNVTITVTASSGVKKTLTLKVVDETRAISASKTVIDKPSKFKLGGPDTFQAFGVTVKDQFGDPINDYEINPMDAISGSKTIAEAAAVAYEVGDPSDYSGVAGDDTDELTDKKGRVVVLVKGGTHDGTATLAIKDENSNTLGSLSVSNRALSGTATDYEMTLALFRLKTLDASDSVDKITYIMVDAYDSSGYRASNTGELYDLIIKVDGDKLVDYDIDTNKYVNVEDHISDGYIKVTAKQVKSDPVTIALYKGTSSIQLTSTTVTVVDNRVKITGATFQSSIPIIHNASGINLKSVLKASGIKTDDGNPVTFRLVSENEILITGGDGNIIGNLKLSVLDGDLYPTFETDSNDDIRIVLRDSDEGESGKIRLTVNRLSGTSNDDGVPDNATSVTATNITVTDLVN